MITFFYELKLRNELLYYFGWLNFILALALIMLSSISKMEVAGTNAWFKPFKFAMSIGIYSWTMAWYTAYLTGFNGIVFAWSIILLLGFEIIYITLQAARGQLSHFNLSTPVTSLLYGLMAMAASLVTLYTAYIGWLFWQQTFPELPEAYVWGIRLGILIFVVFSFQGFMMGSRLSHSVGAPDGGGGLPLLNWSRTHGDLRIAHFIGMHALQVLPLLAYYVVRHSPTVGLIAILYAVLAVYSLVRAMAAKPFW